MCIGSGQWKPEVVIINGILEFPNGGILKNQCVATTGLPAGASKHRAASFFWLILFDAAEIQDRSGPWWPAWLKWRLRY